MKMIATNITERSQNEAGQVNLSRVSPPGHRAAGFAAAPSGIPSIHRARWRSVGLGLALLMAPSAALLAQVPHIMHYQGRVLVGNENFNNTGQFRFALVNEDATVTYWSNDGTLDGSEPVNAVEIDVDKGLYSVRLGDASISNMEPIPPAVFENESVWLRIWFDDGNNGSQLFVPDQRIVSVGYSMMSANVPDGSITAEKLADGAVTTDKIADGAVGSDQIADNALTSEQIANVLTLERLNLGGLDWDGSLHLFSEPSGGGEGGIVNPSGELRGHLIGDLLGSELALRMSNAQTGAVLAARSPGGNLKLWDGLGAMTTFLGAGNGGGDLNLFQINGNLGVKIDGDRSTYNNLSSSGGEISVYTSGIEVGVLIDGDHSRAGRIEVRNNNTPYVDIFGNGSNGGGEIWVKDGNGTRTVKIDGNGPDASLTEDGYLQLGLTAAPNLVLDGNEITARDNGRESALYLNPNQGNVVVGRTSELTPSVRFAVQSDDNQDAVRVRVGGSTKLYVNGQGQVGINTTNVATGFELSVNGQVICEELVVQHSSDWPDYVFAEDYNLMPLEEVEASIRQNRHLPGIPPARHVDQAGISVGDMQVRMMEKIEELTLYVIEQNKRLQAQESELAQLRGRLSR